MALLTSPNDETARPSSFVVVTYPVASLHETTTLSNDNHLEPNILKQSFQSIGFQPFIARGISARPNAGQSQTTGKYGPAYDVPV